MLNNKLGYTHSIMLVVAGSVPRFSAGLQGMIKTMTTIFGASWWDHLLIGVSKWSYREGAVEERKSVCEFYPDECKDEAWFKREFSQQIKEVFGIDRDLPFVFPDSFSQTERNKGDLQQQDHWRQETEKVWKFMKNSETFDFLTIDEILKHNIELREKIANREESIAELEKTVLSNNETILTLKEKEYILTDEVETLEQNIVNKNKTIENLKESQSNLTEEVETLEKTIDNLKDTKSNLTYEVRRCEDQITSRDNQNTDLKTAVSSLESEIGTLEDAVTRLFIKSLEIFINL